MNFCKSKNLSPASNKNWELANREYEAQQQEVNMFKTGDKIRVISERKERYIKDKQEATMSEIKFQDKTRGGYKYRIYTREGMDKDFPLVGEIDCGTYYQCATWNTNGIADDTSDDDYDLIPLEPAELEGLKAGDLIWSITFDGAAVSWEIIVEIEENFKISDDVWVRFDGSMSHVGNGQKMFYRSEGRALASINKEVKNA